MQGVSRLFASRDARHLFLLDVSHLVIDGRLREMELDESSHILYDQVSTIVCLAIWLLILRLFRNLTRVLNMAF